MNIQADGVKADVPFLLGVDALDQHKNNLSVLFILQHITHCGADPKMDGEWIINLIGSNGHLYLPFTPIILDQLVFYARRSWRN